MFQTISMRQLEELLDRGGMFTLVDVRDREEYARGHLTGAVNLPFSELLDGIGAVPKNLPVVLYCAYGGQSMMAARQLDAMGYQAVNAFGGLSYYRGRHFTA